MVAALALIGLLLTGCKPGDDAPSPGPTVVRPAPEGEPRATRIGFSTLPPERSEAAYVAAFATAAQYGDAVLIQRAPPWSDFLPGGKVSKETAGNTRLETSLLTEYHGLELLYAIDPTDGAVQRARIADLPPSIDPRQGFKDPGLREAFKAYTAYVATNYKPAYLALGVEINMLYERNREQFDAFVTLYREAYVIAHAANPGGKVFPTFQLEDLEGTLGDPHAPHWEVLDPFLGTMDALAISTYPYLGGLHTAADLRADYLAQLKQHFQGEIIIAETGYPSAPVEGAPIVGTEEDQRAYLEWLLAGAEASSVRMVIWTAARDPVFAAGPAAVIKDIGLRKADGSNKLAWPSWESWARRPLKP